MESFCRIGLRISMVFYIILHFTSYFYEQDLLRILLSISGLGIFIFAIIKRRIQHIKLPFGLALVGIVILAFSDSPIIVGFLHGLTQMQNMVGLILIIPMISWVLRGENYIESIIMYAHRLLNSSRKFYFGIISFTQIIAYFLLFGSISMMYHFVNTILKNEQGEVWENYKGTALLRGFSLSVMWVISIPSFAYVVEVMNASLGMAIFHGLVISVVGVIIALIFSHFEEKRYGVDLTAGLQTEIDDALDHVDKKLVNRHVKEFALLFISLFGTIFILQAFVNIELLVLIPLVVLVWIITYFLVKRRPKQLTQEGFSYVTGTIENYAYQVCIMLGAGTLIYALHQTSFAKNVVDGIYTVQDMLPFFNILYFLPFIIIILGFCGLGPLTVMVLVAGILESISLPYPPELIVLAVTSGSAISILLSPLIMPLIMLSGANGLSGFTNGIKFNWKYAIVIYIVVQIYIQTMVAIG